MENTEKQNKQNDNEEYKMRDDYKKRKITENQKQTHGEPVKKSKYGRKRLPDKEKRIYRHEICLSKSELDIIKKKASYIGCNSINDYFRICALNPKIAAQKEPLGMIKLNIEVRKYGGNLNQLTTHFNTLRKSNQKHLFDNSLFEKAEKELNSIRTNLFDALQKFYKLNNLD